MRYQRTLLLSASCFFLAFLCSILWGYQQDKNLADRIAPRLLRFHVLASSNSAADQQIKLQIKALILEKLEECTEDSKDGFCTYVREHCRELEDYADTWLMEQGCDYKTSIRLTRAWFPTKAYGNLVLPCGTYDTIQVTLGEGRGRNWWCVVYPRLCFIDSTHGVMPEESCLELKNLLPEDDFDAVMASEPRIHIRFKLLEFLK